MTGPLYFAEPDDLGTPVLDLDDRFTLERVNWGTIPAPATASSGQVAGGEQLDTEPPPVEGEITVGYLDGTDLDTLVADYQLLAACLDREMVLVWQPPGLDPLYVDTFRSAIPPLHRGRDREGWWIVDRLLDAEYSFPVMHHPYARAATVTLAAAQALTNAVGFNAAEVTNPGSAPSEARLELAMPEADARVCLAHVGVHQGEQEFTSYAITGAPAVTDAWQMIHQKVLTPADPAAFAGSYHVLATYMAGYDRYHFLRRSGSSMAGPQADVSGPGDVVHDFSDFTFDDEWTTIDLGYVTYEADDPRLVIELWCRGEVPEDPVAWGNVYLLGADTTLLLSSPGFLSGNYGLERYFGDDLEVTGSPEVTDEGVVILDTQDQEAEVKPVAGRELPIGRHSVEFRGHLKNTDRNVDKIGELQVLADDVLLDKVNLRTLKGQTITRYENDERKRVAYQAEAGTLYREKVVETESTLAGHSIHTNLLRHSFIPTLFDGMAMVLDTEQRRSFIADADGERVAPLKRTGTLYLREGLHTITTLVCETAPAGYDDVWFDQALPTLRDEQQSELTIDVTPRERQF